MNSTKKLTVTELRSLAVSQLRIQVWCFALNGTNASCRVWHAIQKFNFPLLMCFLLAFNWAVEDKSAYQRSSIDIHRAFFETKTTAFLETTKSSWIGSADDDIMPDLRNGDDMNRKKLDLRDLLDLDEIVSD